LDGLQARQEEEKRTEKTRKRTGHDEKQEENAPSRGNGLEAFALLVRH
jgi:hypothetical protein